MMEYDYADHLDLEWQSLLIKYLKKFTYQKNNENKLLQFDEILAKVFCSEIEAEQEDNNKDKELCEKCLTEAVNLILSRSFATRLTQIKFLLNLAKFTYKDETSFINLNANKVLINLMHILRLTENPNDDIKILFIEMLDSFLEHFTGIKTILITQYWIKGIKLILEYQIRDQNKNFLEIGYKFITKLLAKSFDYDEQFCYEILHFIINPLLNAANTLDQLKSVENEHFQMIHNLEPSIKCFIEIIERLLEEYNLGVLKCITNLKIDLASNKISKYAQNDTHCLILNRITLGVSFFKISDIFDGGIKEVNEDLLEITGFLRITECAINRGQISLVFKLIFYALKYLKFIAGKIPQCFLKEKNVDIETELMCFQMEPILLLTTKFDNTKYIKEVYSDLMRMSHITKIVQSFSFGTLKIGLKLKELLPSQPIELFIETVKDVIQSKDLYSKSNLSTIFESLIFSLQDITEHVKLVGLNQEKSIELALQTYVLELLKGIVIFIESFNIHWSDSVKILELANILYGGCINYQWPSLIVVETCKLLKEIIDRRLSPSMSLLIDNDEDIRDFGPLLYRQCFTSEWEVRNEILSLVHTIASSANKSFPSFKNLLLDASLPHLISTMALNDESRIVRATAFKCIQQMIIWNDLDEILPKTAFINKVLDILVKDFEPALKKEVIKLVGIAYFHTDILDDLIMIKVYKHLEYVTLNCSDTEVRVEGINFWTGIAKKYLSHQGWLDKKFPTVTFSKRIICMTDVEVKKRIYKVLNELSLIGGLNALVGISKMNNLSQGVDACINGVIVAFYRLFKENNVTPDSMLFNHDFMDISSSLSSPDPELVLQEIINDTVMKMMPDEDVNFIQDEDLYISSTGKFNYNTSIIASSTNSSSGSHQIYVSPSEFVSFVSKTVQYLSTLKDLDEYVEVTSEVDDIYNVVDY